MRRSRLRSVGLACLLLTAGCLGFLGEGAVPAATPSGAPSPTPSPAASSTPSSTASSSTAPTTSPTSTEDPTTTATPSPTPPAVDLPRNLTEDRFESAEELAAAHGAALRNTSFTVRFSNMQTVNGESTVRVSGVIRYDGARTVYSNVTRTDFVNGSVTRQRFERWSNGTTARRAIVTANGMAVEEAQPIIDLPTYAAQIEIYLRSFSVSVAGWSRLDGKPVTRGSSEELDTPFPDDQPTVDDLAFALGFWEVESGQFSLDVTGSTVRRYRVRLVGFLSDDPTVWTKELRFTRVGTTTVNRPAWVTAENESRSG